MILSRVLSGILADMATSQIECIAHAKINLSLSVGIKQSNGLHEIASRMVSIALHDSLTLTALDAHALSRYAILWEEDAPKQSEIDWTIQSDLTVRAHKLVQEQVGRMLPVQLKLQKRIPVGGGLGGGSADAAAMLVGLKRLFDLDVELLPLARDLGSDVPFHLSGHEAIVTGTGEKISKTTFEHKVVVLCIPPYGCNTGAVYQALQQQGTQAIEVHRVESGEIFNALTEAACDVTPQLRNDLQELSNICECEVHLSGSGSTMFAICDNGTPAQKLAEAIQASPNCIAVVTETCVPENMEK